MEFHGEEGNDYLAGGSGNGVLVGGGGNDDLHGSYGNEVLVGGLGDDQLHGHVGDDLLLDGDGADQLRGSYDDDVMACGNTDVDSIPLDDNTTPDGFDPNAVLDQLFARWRAWTLAISSLNPTSDGDRDDLYGYLGADEFWATLNNAEDLLRDPTQDPGDQVFPL